MSNVPIGKWEIRNIPTLQERQKTEFLQFRFIEIQGQKKAKSKNDFNKKGVYFGPL